MSAKPEVNVPFYFAIPRWAPVAERRRVPLHVLTTYGLKGPIEFVREDKQMRLYRVAS